MHVSEDGQTETEQAAIARVARATFGFDALRPGQPEVMADVLGGEPTVVIMPTGAGKSLCYQLPAILLGERGGVTLVVSPLIALMKDQVDSLRARGVAATALTSAATAAEQAEILAGIRGGVFSLVYVAPERFRSSRFCEAIAATGDSLALLAIDEAHCISEWGHDFRPDYRRLGDVAKRLAPPRLVALTATATPEVRADIATQLAMTSPRFHVHGFDRPNLHYAVQHVGGSADKESRIVDTVRMRTGGVALVYAATRRNVERYGALLTQTGMRVAIYHAGLDDATREQAQDRFMRGELDVIVATNAFGMGVDKANIRVVVHADLPRSPEAYYQEAGRGGRDGDDTDCVLLFNHGDARLQEFLIDASYPSPEVLRGLWKLLRDQPQLGGDPERLRPHLPGEPHVSTVQSALRILLRHGYARDEGGYVVATRPDPGAVDPLDAESFARRAAVERGKLRTMVEYAYYPRCKRQFVLEYFGDADWQDRGKRCAQCRFCDSASAVALTDAQRVEVRELLTLIEGLQGRFGRTRIAAIATATDDDERFFETPARGCLRGQSQKRVIDLIRALEGAGMVEVSRGDYPTIAITARGEAVASGRVDPSRDVHIPLASPKRRKRAAPAVLDAGGELDPQLIERLRSLRSELATEQSVPAYVIFSNKTLEAIARARPTSSAELAALPGIGTSRLEAYGERILAVL